MKWHPVRHFACSTQGTESSCSRSNNNSSHNFLWHHRVTILVPVVHISQYLPYIRSRLCDWFINNEPERQLDNSGESFYFPFCLSLRLGIWGWAECISKPKDCYRDQRSDDVMRTYMEPGGTGSVTVEDLRSWEPVKQIWWLMTFSPLSQFPFPQM